LSSSASAEQGRQSGRTGGPQPSGGDDDVIDAEFKET
jgi:hypothetical protein